MRPIQRSAPPRERTTRAQERERRSEGRNRRARRGACKGAHEPIVALTASFPLCALPTELSPPLSLALLLSLSLAACLSPSLSRSVQRLCRCSLVLISILRSLLLYYRIYLARLLLWLVELSVFSVQVCICAARHHCSTTAAAVLSVLQPYKRHSSCGTSTGGVGYRTLR